MKQKISTFTGISHYKMLDLYIDDVFDIILGDENKRLRDPRSSYAGYVVAHGDKLYSEMSDIERLFNIPEQISCFFIMGYYYGSKTRRKQFEQHYNSEKAIQEIKAFMDEFPEVIEKLNRLYQYMIDNVNEEASETEAKGWND